MTRYYHKPQLFCRFFSVSKHISKNFSLLLISLVLFFVISCEENPISTPKDFLPGSDFVNLKATDTISAVSYTMYKEAVVTSQPSTSFLGQTYDPYFGTTNASFVTQIRIRSAWDNSAFKVDSVRLVLSLLSTQGATDVTHTLKLSEISEQIYDTAIYYSNRTVLTTGYEVNDIVLPVLRSDTVNEVSLPIPESFGDYLLRDPSKLFYNEYNENDFRAYFKGLHFEIVPSGNPLMVSLSLAPNGSNYSNFFVIYLSNAGVSREVFLVLDPTNRNAAYNKISHDFSTATMGNKMENRNILSKPTASDTLSYLQSFYGVYTKISLPGLTDIKNNPAFKNIAVNRARLSVPVQLDGDRFKTSTIPTMLLLRYRKPNTDTTYYVHDYGIDDQSQSHYFFDGRLDTIANVYNFNIPAFVQRYLDNDPDVALPEFELFQTTGTRNVVLKANTSKIPVKFQFTYTKF